MILLRPKIRPLFPNGTNLASFFTRSIAYFLDNLFVFTIRYLVWVIFSLLWFYDSLLNFADEFKATFSYTLSKPLQQFEYYEMLRFAVAHNFFLDVVFVVSFVFAIGAVYYIFMLYTYQQSLGKKAFGLKLLDNSTEKSLPLWRIILRYVVGLVPWLLLGIVVILTLVNQAKMAMAFFVISVIWYDPLMLGRDRRSMHDYICSSRVIRIKKRRINDSD
ncbi:MAG: hypothetical protein HON23_02350 [Rickettsiales bacterium]|nr:hypothetical protein [Rickettsiales bacterium]